MVKSTLAKNRIASLAILLTLMISLVISPWLLTLIIIPLSWIIINNRIKIPNKNLFNQWEQTHEALIDIAVETWRLSRAFESLLKKSSLEEQGKYEGKLIWFQKKLNEALEKSDVRLVNLERKKYDLGMAVKAINLEDFNESDNLYIDKMLEPIVVGENGVIRTGTVTLERAINE